MKNINHAKLIILGTAQDGGIPQMGCSCSNCQNAWNNPTTRRLVSSIAIVQNNRFLLIDPSPDLKEQINLLTKRFQWKKPLDHLQAILLTHAHIGHYLGLAQLGFEVSDIKQLPLFCTPRMKEFLIHNEPWAKLINDGNLVIKLFSVNGRVWQNQGLQIFSFEVPHRNEFTDTVGFFIIGPKKKTFFLPDFQSWEGCSPSMFKLLKRSDLVLVDGTFFTKDEISIFRHRKHADIGHPPINESIKFLTKFFTGRKIPQLFFTHLHHTNLALKSNSRERKLLQKNKMFLAKEGLEFGI